MFQSLAAELARGGIRPNTISLVGMLAATGAGVALAATGSPDAAGAMQRLLFVAAALLVQVRLICNMLDGMVAVEGRMRSATGELFNEVPDRVSDVAVLVGAGFAAGSSPTIGFSAAIAAMFTAYVRAIGKGTGLASDFRGPMAKQQRMFLVTVACVYCAAAPAAWRIWLPGFWDSPEPGVMVPVLGLIVVGSVMTAWRRLVGIARALKERG